MHLFTGVLGNCSQFVDQSPYQTACVYDLCHTDPDNDIICDAVELFIRTCQEASDGTVEIGNWRDLLPRCSTYSVTPTNLKSYKRFHIVHWSLLSGALVLSCRKYSGKQLLVGLFMGKFLFNQIKISA